MGFLKKIESLPKTTIAAVISAVLVFCSSRGYIGPDVSDLLSAIFIAIGLGVNTRKFTGK